MMLVVSLDDFLEAIKRHDPTGQRTVYRHVTNIPSAAGSSSLFGGGPSNQGHILHVTYGVPREGFVIAAEGLVGSMQEVSDFEYTLKQHGITVVEGVWMDQPPQGARQPAAERVAPTGQYWVAAVAYQSAEDEPGLWMDAFDREPNEEEVLRAMYDEFVRSGDLVDASYEDFVTEATPTVQIASARDIQEWMRQ
ncbi:MAG: hypothetical protein AMXMBFR61_03260 [Fimbriimonadales bacterium]